MTIDISNFYLMTSPKQPDYMKVKLAVIPQGIIDKYNLKDKATPAGSIHMFATKGIYGLP